MPTVLSLIEDAIKATSQWAEEISEGAPLSPSAIYTWKSCGLKYYFRYIKKIKTPPRAAWVWGGSGHNAIAVDLEVKRKTGGQAVPEKQLLQLFESTFEDKFRAVEKSSEEKPLGTVKDEFMQKGRDLMHLYKTEGEPVLHPHPDKIEHKLEYPVEVLIKGKPEIVRVQNHVDLITIEPNIVDHKFKSRTPPKPLFAPLQLVSYALAYEYNHGVIPNEVRRDDYVALKTKARIIPQTITKQSIDKQARMALTLDVMQVVRGARDGIFHLPQERGSYPCTANWCAYWSMGCPYGGGPATGHKLEMP